MFTKWSNFVQLQAVYDRARTPEACKEGSPAVSERSAYLRYSR
jgi:hypothetical protein